MTQNERAQIWARKDQLSQALKQLPVEDKRSQAHVKERTDICN